jgi:hypothetical protein
MTTVPTSTPHQNRGIRILLWVAVLLFVLALLALHGNDLFSFGSDSWMICGWIAIVLNWLLPRAQV